MATDPKEQAERKEAAAAYTEENSSHFVDYLRECVQTSVNAKTEIRALQDECWRVYMEEEPYNFAYKDDWQSKVTYPKPYRTVESAAAIIRKIFEMEFLSVEKKGDNDGAMFWRDLLLTLLGRSYAKFPTCFADATSLALAIGQSKEMIPYWIPYSARRPWGLRYSLIEPVNIHRDPDALPRQPHSGEYWIHQEYQDYHRLLAQQEAGRYFDVEKTKASAGVSGRTSPESTQEEVARRKMQIYQKNKFVDSILTFEFWGTVVGPKGELLMDDARYTVAGDHIIEKPDFSPYPTLRWPGVGYSALPHPLRFDGRGLIQGIRSLWYLMCNLMSLHADHMNWSVNPMIEIDIYQLIDETDTDVYPGKNYFTHTTQHGQKVVRPVDFKSEVGDIMAILNFMDQRHQDGSLLDAKTMGLPGYRAEVTKGEAAQDLDQSMILVGAMGKNVEDGALDAIMAAAETIMISMTYDELVKIMGKEVAEKYKADIDDEHPMGLALPELTSGTFHVSGISGVMKDQEVLKHLMELKDVFESDVFKPFTKPFGYLKAIEKRMYLEDENLFISKEDAEAINQKQQQGQEDAMGHDAATKEAEAAAAAANVDKTAGLAAKAHGEGDANQAQAELFKAQAGAVQPGGEGAGAPEGTVQ
jgi:hypothetical protein